MTILTPIHSSHDHEEDDPRYHTNDECPEYQHLAHEGYLAVGTGGYALSDWCANPPK
ncbi:MAG TPA: hypothetical protein VED59_04960 [Acidimicrobiales bacterium]|nr:hypothetical protein [Acidimicrobiales bacterium]